MSLFRNPFDPAARLASQCSCGRHATQADHDKDGEALASSVVEQAVMRALFPQDEVRRHFLKTVGASTALAAVSTFFPLGAAKEAFAQGAGKLEKQKLAVGFIPITCATPIIMAHPMGFYSKYGLDV